MDCPGSKPFKHGDGSDTQPGAARDFCQLATPWCSPAFLSVRQHCQHEEWWCPAQGNRCSAAV